MIVEDDCGVTEGINYKPLKTETSIMIPLSEIVEGKYSLEKILIPNTKKILIEKDELFLKKKQSY